MNAATRIALAAGAATAAGVVGLVAAPWYYQPRPLTRALQRTWPGILFDVHTDAPVFSLTFDDGPHEPYTAQVLDILAEHDARATFFLMGEQIERHPWLFDRIVREGHQVANHFYDDRHTIWLSNEDVLDSLERTERLLGAHNPSRLVRPSGGMARASTRSLLESAGYSIVLGSAYTSDPTNPPRAYMRWAFRQMLEPGRIVILHDGRRERQRTVDVLPAILDEADALGLRAVTVDALLRHRTEFGDGRRDATRSA